MVKKTKIHTGRIATEVGIGLAAVGAAAAAGYYFYASKNAKKHRKIASTWANAMKKEVVREARNFKKVTAEDIAMIVDRARRVYQDIRDVDTADVKRAAQELKTNWKLIRQEASAKKKKSQKALKKTAKKTG